MTSRPVQTIDELPESRVEILENGIVNKLKTRINFLECIRWSEPFSEYEFEHPNGSLLVQCLAINYEKFGDNVLKANYTLAVIVSIRSDYGETKVSRILEYITNLVGKCSVGGFNMPLPVSELLQSKDETNWLYEITFTVEGQRPVY